jgi:hypothetical protein
MIVGVGYSPLWTGESPVPTQLYAHTVVCRKRLLNCYGFRQVPWLVHVAASTHRNVIGKQL